MNSQFKFLTLLTGLFLLLIVGNSSAQQLVYTPVNPSFGGNALNGNWMLTSAQLQDNTTDPSETVVDDPIAEFKKNLNRTILNQLSRQISESLFGETGLEAGQFTFGDFIIDVTESPDGLSLVIFDIITGNETTIFIPYP